MEEHHHSKSHKYWKTHKDVWYQKLNGLDSKIQRRIFSNPHCREGRKLGFDTHKKVTSILGSKSAPNKK